MASVLDRKIERSRLDLCRLLSSRDPKDGDVIHYNPFNLGWMDTFSQDENWRRHAINKARIGIISLHSSLARKGDPRASHQFLWSEVDEALVREFVKTIDTMVPSPG